MKAQCNLRVERVGGLVRQLTTKAVDPALAPGHRLGRPATRVLAAAPTKEAEIEMFEAATRTQTSTEEVAHSAPGTSGRIVLEGEDELRSTWEHRLWVGATTGLLAGTFANGLSHVTGPADAAWAAGAAFLAYVLSDLGTGIYHWAVDNYGDGNTPIVGGQIAAFQGHHRRPWTITEREFCNNVHKVFAPAAPFSALLFTGSFWAAPGWSVGLSSFLFLACMSQQFHAWSHMKRSELHPAIVAAQEAGILISRKAHGAHHKAPFEGNYSIVSGWWNPVLDGDGGEGSFFRKLEKIVYDMYGVEPRCWHEPRDDWMEEERASGTAA